MARQGLAVRVQRQRARDAAAQRVVQHEVHGAQVRQQVALDRPVHDAAVVGLHALGVSVRSSSG
jgi:hypothetical protein